MNPEIQDYFTEPEEIIKKSCEVLQFQRQHRRRLLSYLLQSVNFTACFYFTKYIPIWTTYSKSRDFTVWVRSYESTRGNRTTFEPRIVWRHPSTSNHVFKDTSSVRVDTVRPSRCARWKPGKPFPRDNSQTSVFSDLN